MGRAVVAVLLWVVALAALAGPGMAQTAERSVSWRRFDVDLEVRTDGSLGVTETQEIEFRGTYERGFRVVPTERTTGISDVSVAEVVEGTLLPYARGAPGPNTYGAVRSDAGVHVDWRFPPTTNRTRTFVVKYTVHGAVRVYDAGDQVQWKTVYADRPGELNSSTITVRLPADVPAEGVRSAFYRYREEDAFGAVPVAGSGERIDDRTVRFSVGPLRAGVGAEVRVQFPHGIVTAGPPPWQAEADRADWVQQTLAPLGGFLALLLAVGVLAGGGAVLLVLWQSTGRDPRVGRVPPRLDEPPSDLPAPLAGTLVDEVANVHDAVATLADLAGRGVITLREEYDPRLVGSTRDVRVQLHGRLDDPRLRPYERTLLAGLFGPTPEEGAEVRLSAVKLRFAALIPLLQAQLHQAVADEGLFVRHPEATRQRYRTTGWGLVGLGALLAFGAAVLLGWAVATAWLPGVALAIVGLALVRLARAMPRRTRHGALEAARWRAFRAYLLNVGDGRLASDTRAAMEKYLPYAVALGVDREFLHRLEAVGAPPPSWYGRRVETPGGVVVLPGGWHGGPWTGVPGDGGAGPRGSRPDRGEEIPAEDGAGRPSAPSPQSWSDHLADLLNSASDALASGGGSGDWGGGGFGGGGGGGGGSGGFE
jgi:uncharacterized membrane protein YgcG